MIARAVIDLPDPDSPTIPSASPAPMCSDTSWMTRRVAAVDGQVDGQCLDLQDRLGRHLLRSDRFAIRSPSTLKATTVTTIIRPAARHSCG